MSLKLHENLTLEKWFSDWFGYYKGREIGTPNRKYYTDPNILLEKVKECAEKKLPCFMSVQPYCEYNTPCAIEKIFFDFDVAHKNEKFTEKELIERKKRLNEEVKNFVQMLSFEGRKIKPLIVKTRRGFHVYIFLDQIYEFNPKNIDFAKAVYNRLCHKFLDRIKGEFIDSAVVGNIKQLARVPLSIHEKTGKLCIIVDENLKPTKIRRIDFYKLYGLRKNEIMKIIKEVNEELKIKKEYEKKLKSLEPQNKGWNYVRKGNIRPCFQYALKIGEMSHQQRLALLLEAYCSGITDEDDLVNVFRPLHDFKEDVTRYQVKWFLNHLPKNPKPYQCKTIYKYGWCLGDTCPLYKKKIKKVKK